MSFWDKEGHTQDWAPRRNNRRQAGWRERERRCTERLMALRGFKSFACSAGLSGEMILCVWLLGEALVFARVGAVGIPVLSPGGVISGPV